MKTLKALIALSLLTAAPASFAALSSSYQFNGQGNWSIDGAGDGVGAGGGLVESQLRATVPAGSTVERAFLYSSTYFGAPRPSLRFGESNLAGQSWTALGLTGGPINQLQAFRSDVTAQVAATVAPGGEFTFSVRENTPGIDGQVLVVVYSNAAERERTIALLDGFSDTNGDRTEINLADPLTAEMLADPDFEASMSLGIGFGAQSPFIIIPQESRVDVNGTRMTSSAGGQDDGFLANGGLITVGDTYDDDFLTNPADPFGPAFNERTDDEAYNLTPFLNVGDTVITLDTVNPSGDDNIFFAGFNLTAVAGVNGPPPTQPPPIDPPPGQVSEPGTTLLLLLGLAGLAGSRRRG